MKKITVNTNKRYDVLIGDVENALSSFVSNYKKVLIVCDSNIERLYLNDFVKELNKEVVSFVFKAGEKSKSFDTYKEILDCLVKNDFTREDLIIAFGGGVVGDIASFVASTFLRGIGYVMVPTTLLSMIDSSVGGKCAINYQGYKNYVGSFYQPNAVFVNPKYLNSLPENELQNGLGEGIKYYALIGETLTMPDMISMEGIEDFIFDCLSYKAEIVSKDEKDTLDRKLLNLGHTIAHAIEEDSSYEIPHGIAVANGVLMMAKSSFFAGRLQEDELNKIATLLDVYSIETLAFSSIEDVKKYVNKDKKSTSDGEIDAVIISGLGECNIARMDIESFLSYIAKSAVYEQ